MEEAESPTGPDFITEFGNKVLRKGGPEALEDLCTDIAANICITKGRVEQIVQAYDLMDFVGECAVLLQLNRRLEILNRHTTKPAKTTGKGITEEERERRNSYLRDLPPGLRDTREMAKGLGVSTISLGNYLKYHAEETGFRKATGQYMWEK